RFFFSSRRRHTRFSRDWSSDVCSSDLELLQPPPPPPSPPRWRPVEKPVRVRTTRAETAVSLSVFPRKRMPARLPTGCHGHVTVGRPSRHRSGPACDLPAFRAPDGTGVDPPGG